MCVHAHVCHAWVLSVPNRLTKTVNTTFISQKEEQLIKMVKLQRTSEIIQFSFFIKQISDLVRFSSLCQHCKYDDVDSNKTL